MIPPMNPHLTVWITDLADTGVVLPLSALLVGLLWYLESAHSAWLFGRALLACLITMAVLKVIFISCGHAMGSSINSPSGHTSLGMFFYGTVAILFWVKRPGIQGILASSALALLVCAIAVSRLLLNAHNLPEVIVGACVGALALTLFAIPYLRQKHPSLKLKKLGLILVPVFILTYGTVLPAEQMLRQMLPLFHLDICSA